MVNERVARRALVLLVLTLGGCDSITARRLTGQWETENRPKRTLDLFADDTYALRLSGKGLGFVSEILGPEKGTWRVEGGALVLARKDDQGVETTRKLPIGELKGDAVVLGGDRWRRLSTD